VLIVAANKCDLVNRRVSKELVDSFQEQHGFEVREVSAKSGLGVQDLFKFIAEEIFKRRDDQSKKPV